MIDEELDSGRGELSGRKTDGVGLVTTNSTKGRFMGGGMSIGEHRAESNFARQKIMLMTNAVRRNAVRRLYKVNGGLMILDDMTAMVAIYNKFETKLQSDKIKSYLSRIVSGCPLQQCFRLATVSTGGLPTRGCAPRPRSPAGRGGLGPGGHFPRQILVIAWRLL
jgi:hypothetical protein